MEETKQKESVYSGEPTKITGPDSLRSTTAATVSSGPERTASKQTQTAQKVVAPQISQTINQTRAPGTMVEFAEFLKRTKFVWLIVAGAIFGIMAVVTIVTRMSERARNAREKRQEQAVLEVAPENLIARCGPPAEDVTKEMYPVVLRTMTYQRGENEKILFEFSRTAEAKSDWVFLSMKDQSGAANFETPEAKIAALPCLDSKK
jgi:hypothetical protein